MKFPNFPLKWEVFAKESCTQSRGAFIIFSHSKNKSAGNVSLFRRSCFTKKERKSENMEESGAAARAGTSARSACSSLFYCLQSLIWLFSSAKEASEQEEAPTGKPLIEYDDWRLLSRFVMSPHNNQNSRAFSKFSSVRLGSNLVPRSPTFDIPEPTEIWVRD